MSQGFTSKGIYATNTAVNDEILVWDGASGKFVKSSGVPITLVPSTLQKQAMDNANSPDAINPFATIDDLAGGLPTGQMPTDFISEATPANYNSGTFTTVTGSTMSVTISNSSARIWAIFAWESSENGGGSAVTGEVRAVINAVGGVGVVIDIALLSNEAASTHLRSALLTPGVYDIHFEARRVSGTRNFSIDKLKGFAIGLQAPKGDTGAGVPTGGNANEVLAKIDGTDYNTQWAAPSGGFDPNLSFIYSKLYS